jgi:hypothetical protein
VLGAGWLLLATFTVLRGAHFTRSPEVAAKFGVHEVQFEAAALPDGLNPFDARVAVTFTPPSGAGVTVDAFHDGARRWAARVYVSEPGEWRWSLTRDGGLRFSGDTTGRFEARPSALRGRLLAHPQNRRQWMTENGRWFLNLNDTAYFLFAPQDTRGEPISDETFRAYVRDAAAQGITSLRAFLTWGEKAAWQDDQVWSDAYFPTPERDRLAVENFQRTDARLTWMLDHHPELYLQVIMVPRGSRWGADETHWHTFSPEVKQRLLRTIVARYAAFPQVFWLAVNDAHYGANFPRNAALAREIGEYLQRSDPWQHPYSTGPARNIEVPFAAEPWLTYVHLERRWDLGAGALERYRALEKPVFLGEDYYEHDRPNTDPEHMDYFQRRLFWAWLFSGGSANYGGRWSTLHPYRATAGREFRPFPKHETKFDRALRGLASVPHIRRYFSERQIELSAFAPAAALASVPGGHTPAGAPKVMRRGSEDFLVYHPHAAADGKAANVKPDTPAQLALDLTQAPGEFTVEWFRASDGTALPAPKVRGGTLVTLTAPWLGADVVLRLRAMTGTH